jgi:AcrR family transcriptional regulator
MGVPFEAHSDVSERIMQAAKDLFFARGFGRTALRTIASEAGTSESGVLRVYGSKSGLLRAVYASCWADINARLDVAMVTVESDPDPCHRLVGLMRAVWQVYREDPPMMTFLLSHFGFRETNGLETIEDVDPTIDESVRQEYRRYLCRIHDLCNSVIDSRPDFARAGVTPAALGHTFTSIIYGIQTSWCMAQQEGGTTLPQVSLDEALSAAKFFLRPEALAS